jgi:tight adherence protein B
MPFDLDQSHLFVLLAAASVVMFVEAAYLLLFSNASYRNRINHRLRLMQSQPDRESILVQLRRERGLTAGGLYSLPLVSLNRLLLQSGMTLSAWKFGLLVAAAAAALAVAVFVTRGNAVQAAAAFLIAAVLGPLLALQALRKRRHKKFGEQFPDAIDIIVRSLRAGHPVPVAIAMVARELRDPVGTEFGIVSDEVTYGADLESAMRNLYFRVGQEDLPLFVTAVAIQGSTGGNLSEILENLSAVIRLRFKMRRKIRALAAEGKFSAIFLSGLPVAIFFLLRMVTPEFYDSVWHFDITKIGLAMAAGWMALGNYAMYRLVNLRI